MVIDFATDTEQPALVASYDTLEGVLGLLFPTGPQSWPRPWHVKTQSVNLASDPQPQREKGQSILRLILFCTDLTDAVSFERCCEVVERNHC